MLNDLPLVSVLMTSYNREKYITAAIESVLRSTYKNFELIIVDDCSTDKTVEIAKGFAAVDSRVIVFVNDTNLGDYPNRNKAASLANGKYLKYVDADDMIYPHGLGVMVTMMEKFPKAGYGICSKVQNSNTLYPIELVPEEAYRFHYFKQNTIFNRAPLSAIINREVFNAVGGFSGKRMVGDFEMWHKLSLSYPVVLMPQGLTWYRTHTEQETSSRNFFLLDSLAIADKFVRMSPLNNNEKSILLGKLQRHMVLKLIKNPMNMSLKSRLKFLKKSTINIPTILSF